MTSGQSTLHNTDDALNTAPPWNILIVDDDEDVFNVTQIVLRRTRAMGRPLALQHCSSAQQARETLTQSHDIAVVITDVVMEQDDAGLNLAKWIRAQPHLSNTRIVIRTGQPGRAPERQVLETLDINDYWTKQDLSSRRIQTLLTGLLRSYRDLQEVSRTSVEAQEQLSRERAALHSLMKQHSLFRVVSESLAAGTILVNGGRVIYANSTAAELLNCAMEDIADTIKANLDLADLPGQTTLQLHVKEKLRWLDVRTALVHQENIHGQLITLSNITLQVEMAKDQLLHERDLMRIQHLEQIGLITSGVAHDLNNLLTVIMGSAQYIEDQTDSDDLKQCITDISEAGQAAATLVQQLMIYGMGGQAIRQPTNLTPAFRDSVRIWVAEGRKQNIQIQFSADFEGDLWAEIAESQVQQLVANLISNALRSSPENTLIRVTIRQGTLTADEIVRASVHDGVQPGSFAILSFKDTGVGIGEAAKLQLFQPFYTTHRAGRGLGLATVKRIANQLCAAIFVESKFGEGARFDIAIPLIQPAALQAAPPAVMKTPTSPHRILILDDSVSICRMLCRTLRKAGYEPLAAHTIEEAVEHLRSPVSLAILDFILENTTGDLALKTLRKLQPEMPAILCSGYISPAHHDRLHDFRYIIHKPFSVREILTAVANLLSDDALEHTHE